MNLPEALRLDPHVYEIRSDDEAIRSLTDEGRRGDSSSDSLVIRVDSTLPHTSLAETLLHECLHMCWKQAAVNEMHDNLGAWEEAIVKALAPRLMSLLRSNPDLVAFVTAES